MGGFNVLNIIPSPKIIEELQGKFDIDTLKKHYARLDIHYQLETSAVVYPKCTKIIFLIKVRDIISDLMKREHLYIHFL